MDISGFLTIVAKNAPQILLAILVFGVLIFVHELGHFAAAKWSGIRVNEFAMGMGPAIFKRSKGETLYALRLFPIGGFCAMEGEDEESADSRSFGRAPLIKRIIVSVAGSFMNLVLGLIILGILSAHQPLIATTTIAKFYDDSVTNQWLQVGDTIKSINNYRVRTANDMNYEFMRDRDSIMDIEVERPNADGSTEKILLKSVKFNVEKTPDGIESIKRDFMVLGVKPTFLGVVSNAFNWTGSIIKMVWGGFVDLLTGRYGLKQISGPVGVTSAIGQAISFGWESFFILVALITVNLGVFNLLPVPALDGGRLIFLLVEAVRRKPVNPRYEGFVHGVGFLLLIGLMIFATVSDVSKLKLIW